MRRRLAAFVRHHFVVDMRCGLACALILGCFVDPAVVGAGLAP
jgi:hypothetical protein